MNNTEQIQQYCRQYKITGISSQLEQLTATAEAKGSGFMEFILTLFKAEAEHRQASAQQ
jgi:hypothetical protein